MEMGEKSPWFCTFVKEWEEEEDIMCGSRSSGGVSGVDVSTLVVSCLASKICKYILWVSRINVW